VRSILALAAKRCHALRAGIRLPLGARARTFITVVNNPVTAGSPPARVAPDVLGTLGGEATMFSWDVSVQKARTALLFSNPDRAMSTGAVGFLAQRFFPPDFDGRAFGPLFGLGSHYIED